MDMDSNEEQIEDVLKKIKKLGCISRHPHDPFFKEANDICEPLKLFGICDYENEDFFHKPYLPFACHVPGCTRKFETVMEFETHYNSCHCFTCCECKKNLPNYHLLDLHISENHDSFFMELAKRKPMFQCFVPECKETFMDPTTRHKHSIEVHKFPSDFRFDTHKGIRPKHNKGSKKSTEEGIVINDGNLMDVCTDNSSKKGKGKKTLEGFSFGHSKGRKKPTFYNFSKDLMDNLPNS